MQTIIGILPVAEAWNCSQRGPSTHVSASTLEPPAVTQNPLFDRGLTLKSHP